MKYDFTIIGSGIIGLTLAFKLKQKFNNSKIAIFEKEPNSKNIFSEIFFKDALSEAKNSEDRQKKGRRKSFFDGIVINWKDLSIVINILLIFMFLCITVEIIKMNTKIKNDIEYFIKN